MFFFPIGCLVFILFIFLLPLLFVLIFFNIVGFGFEKLGFSSETTLLLLFLILVGSMINIPLTKQKKVWVERSYLSGMFKRKRLESQGIKINLGGAIIPIFISVYFLTKIPLEPVIIAIVLMAVISHHLARIIPGQGIALSAFIPPLFSAFFALILMPEFAAPCAFTSGVMGTLIGADIANLKKIQRISPGTLSIGGAGVFDGIFLVGIVSAFLTAI